MEEETDNSSLLAKLIILFIAVSSAAAVVTIYHCITSTNICALLRRRRGLLSTTRPQPPRATDNPISFENSLAELIPAHKYRKGKEGLAVAEDEAVCAVCLCNFEEDEEVRSLPGCSHSFHAPCIDMWLYSHASCPVCRASAVASPSPRLLVPVLQAV